MSKNQLPTGYISSGYMNLIFRGRMLWRDMSTWLTLYMFSVYGQYPNQQVLADRLYQLPLEYGNTMRLIFGDKISEDYITLLSNYIITLESLFNAQLMNDQNAINEYVRRLYQNINQRAAFLGSINPYWQESVWNTMLYAFNNMIVEESFALLTSEYDRSVDVFNRLLAQSTIIGDYFSEGIYNYLMLQRTSV